MNSNNKPITMKKMLHRWMPVLLAVTAMTGGLSAQTGPGGVGGYEDDIDEGQPVNSLWLRAHDLSLSDGDQVTQWGDVSGYVHSAATGLSGADGITYQTDRINGYPWVHFAGVNYLRVADHDALDGGEGLGIFVVAKRDSFKVEKYGTSSNLVTKRAHWNAWSHIPEISMDAAGLQHAYEIRWDEADKANPDTDSANITAFLNGNLPDGAGSDVFPTPANTGNIEVPYLISWAYTSHPDSYGAFVRINGTMTNRRYEGNPNPITIGNVINSPKDLWLGAAQLDPPGAFGDNPDKDDACPTCTEESFLEGALAEVIVYKGSLWHTHVFIIENYLSLKYGLPIDSAKYYDDTLYVHELVGIGNEMGDDKIHARSISSALAIEALNESLDAPKEYLFAAHDGAGFEMVSGEIEGASRWGRAWKLKKMGEVDAAVTFDFIEAGLVMETVQNYRVAYKATPEDPYTMLDIMPRKVFRSLVFNLEGEDLRSGIYTLAYMDGSGTGLKEHDLSYSLEVYPNPADGLVQLRFGETIEGPLAIRVLDYTGRELKRFSDRKAGFTYSCQIRTGDLEPGTYFVEIRIDDYYAVKPLVKR